MENSKVTMRKGEYDVTRRAASHARDDDGTQSMVHFHNLLGQCEVPQYSPAAGNTNCGGKVTNWGEVRPNIRLYDDDDDNSGVIGYNQELKAVLFSLEFECGAYVSHCALSVDNAVRHCTVSKRVGGDLFTVQSELDRIQAIADIRGNVRGAAMLNMSHHSINAHGSKLGQCLIECDLTILIGEVFYTLHRVTISIPLPLATEQLEQWFIAANERAVPADILAAQEQILQSIAG